MQRAQHSRRYGGRATVTPPAMPGMMLAWAEMTEEDAGLRVEQADADHDGLVRLMPGDIHVCERVLSSGSATRRSARACTGAQPPPQTGAALEDMSRKGGQY